ncbi:type II toxin-antitoxin system VapC family toxin [Desulfopila sp. IMCC35008]|uniref:type II toxin-antitoxin system VapC family toxin n=1 Tax=Desulfopila sp. IMCC35008 TaxID=2653858 RepID=UPI0013D65DAF|nr:type II toxin-antitoxin system VapC family toxin [Desulfopila sp. IMCC35008]
MKYLLDTCVLSELIKKAPEKKVVSWISDLNEDDLYLSVLTIGEIYKGVEKLQSGAKKTELHNWVSNELRERFKGRILDFDLPTASIWGKLQGESESVGRPMSAIDGQIAATGVSNNLTIATRNISDMEVSGVSLYNPWE